MKSLFIKLSLIFLFVFNLNLFAADECRNTDYSSTLSTSNTSYTQTDSVYFTQDRRGRQDWNSQTYYIRVAEPGSVKITITNASGGSAQFTYSERSCPSYTGTYETVKTYNFNSPTDFNVYVDAPNLQPSTNYTIKFEFTSANTPPTIIPNQTFSVTAGSANGTVVGSVATTGSAPTSFSITSANSTFSISNTGAISVLNSSQLGGSGTVFTLTVTASNSEGSTSETVTITVAQAITIGGRNFVQRQQNNLFGDVKVIGNTVLCVLDTRGQCVEPSNISNNSANLQKAPISYSTLNIPAGSTIEYARIYWQGRKAATSNNLAWDSASMATATSIQIRKGNTGPFTQLTADVRDFDSTQSTNWIRVYSASADAINVVNGSGQYYINTATFDTQTGATSSANPQDGLGAYGAWVLVVVYQDPNETKARNVTIFDGYRIVQSGNSINIPVSGFLTPRSGTVDSKTYVFAAEGDRFLTNNGDVIKMAGLTFNTTLRTLGTFDSRVDVTGVRSPSLNNNNGIDIHLYDTGTTPGARNIITTNETGANFQFTSDQDTYFPSLIVFSTELFLPQMCYDYSLKQDGRYFKVDRATYPKAQIDNTLSSSDLEVTVYLRNKEADIPAEGIAIRTDVNSTQFDHVGNVYTSNVNGTSLIDRGTPTSVTPLCDYDINGDNSVSNRGCTDGHNIRKGNGRLGANEYVYTQFTLKPKVSGVSDINSSLGLSVRYYITANGLRIPYPDYVLGGLNVPLCPPTTSYNPQWGQFNVVQRNNLTNNIYTQVSRKPFDVDVVFDSTPLTGNNEPPTSDVNTTVLVEMIDANSFGDINASCGKPDANISVPIVVPLNLSTSSPRANVPTQLNDYYNFAVENGTFRIWYFDDMNQTLIQNWTATTTNNSKTITSISGLYKPSIHTACATACSNSSSTTCFTCIKNNYAKGICSRDNFAVRPESYSVHIFDIDPTLGQYDITVTPNHQKNLTKIDLSLLTRYAPGKITADYPIPDKTMDLAAGYNYRFDINSTGNDGMNYTPGYATDLNGTMIWTPKTPKAGCNDIESPSYQFHFVDGQVVNQELSTSNVGEYLYRMIDKTWTAVDWRDTTHHITSNAFTSGNDCIVNSDTTTTSTAQPFNGCDIQTNHGADSNANIYRDHDITFHPYAFNTTGLAISLATDNSSVPANNAYIYTANINNDESMSIHINGTVRAVGYDNNPVSNFVNNCYAVPLDFNLSKSNTTLKNANGNVAYKSRFHRINASGFLLVADDINTTETNASLPMTVSVPPSYFDKDYSGTINTIFNVNYDRNASAPTNPKIVTYNSYDINCTNELQDCMIYADLIGTRRPVSGSLNINQNITHYYGRTNAPRQRFVTPVGTDKNNLATDFIYYEVYSNSKTLLPAGTDYNSTDDPRWFVNPNHTNGFGTAGTINQKGFVGNTGKVQVVTNPTGNHQDSSQIYYDASSGYPYKTTMQNSASNWLIYNQYNQNAIANEFQVEFINGGAGWAGAHETSTTTNATAAPKTNRRVMW